MQRIHGFYINKSKNEVPFDIQIPSKWEELYAQQASFILEVLSYRKADKYTIAASLLTLLFDKHYHILAHLEDDELDSLMPTTNFLIETRPPIKNYYTTLKLNKKVCLAPADDLGNISFGEWCFAYQVWHYYMLTKDKSYLNKLIAILYRPADPDMHEENVNYSGDLRLVFNENKITQQEKAVKDIEIRFKEAVLAWFTTAIYNIMQDRPHVFPVNEDPADDNLPVPADDTRTWLSVFRELLGPKWGTEDKLRHTNAMFVLDGLEEQEIALQATKASM